MRTARVVAVPALAATAALALAGCTGGGAQAGSTTGSAGSATVSASEPGAASGDGSVPAGAVALQNAFIRVVNNVRSSVVQITTSSGLGSGIVFDNKGDIVTNDHVVGQAKTFSVQFLSGHRAKATLVGAFPGDDLAVIRVSGVRSSDLNPAHFANSSKLQVGEIVLAIGNPLAYSSSVTNGIISAVGRTVLEPKQKPSPGGVIVNAIQTSAPINPGNSGGALVDLAGQVVGIPTLAAVDPEIGGAAIGIGFAIPSNTVKDIAGQIIKYGHVVNSHRAELGIYPAQAVNGLGQPAGVGVGGLVPNSPAAKAGISRGDVIVAIDGTPTKTIADLTKELAQLKPGQTVKVKVVRSNGSTTTVEVKLGTLPGTA